MYSVTMQNQTIVADATLVIIHTDSTLATGGSNIEIMRAWVGQQASETSDQLGVMIALKASAFGTYTSTTPQGHFVGGRISGIVGGLNRRAKRYGASKSPVEWRKSQDLWQQRMPSAVADVIRQACA